MTSEEILLDQWKTAGNCKFCRRASYCKKRCSANKKRAGEYVANVMDHDVAVRYVKARHQEINNQLSNKNICI